MALDTIRRLVNPVVSHLKDNTGAGTELTVGAVGEGIIGRVGTTLAPAVQLDSSVHSLVQVGTTGIESWFFGPLCASAITSAVAAKGVIRLIPICLSQKRTVDRIGFNVNTTPGTSTSLGRSVIYRAQSTWNPYPGPLVLDGGEFDCTTTGFKVATLTGVTLEGGVLYWIGTFFGGTGTAPTVDVLNGTGPAIAGAIAVGLPTFITNYTYATQTVTYGAPPIAYPSGSAISSGALPAVALRFSA